MKKILLIGAAFFLFSCAKEKLAPPVSGTWTIVESNIGTGTGFTVQTYSPSTELNLQFGPGNHLVLSGQNPGTAKSPLWLYDKYEILSGDKIRFYQSAGTESMEAFVTISGELYLNYVWARCGYEEKFLKVR